MGILAHTRSVVIGPMENGNEKTVQDQQTNLPTLSSV